MVQTFETNIVTMMTLHMIPMVPFNIINFVIGISNMSFGYYMLAQLGMIPGLIIYFLIGSTFSDVKGVLTGS